ncbi:hypothetical protein FB007_10176 [Sinorhizobium medicae]|nr:hypothetical protein FB007_10176 [Sinorhizobium medicae]
MRGLRITVLWVDRPDSIVITAHCAALPGGFERAHTPRMKGVFALAKDAA